MATTSQKKLLAAAEEGQEDERWQHAQRLAMRHRNRPASAFGEADRPSLRNKRDVELASASNGRASRAAARGALPQAFSVPYVPKAQLLTNEGRELSKALLQRPGSALEFRAAKEDEREHASRWHTSLKSADHVLASSYALEGKADAVQDPRDFFGMYRSASASRSSKQLSSAVDGGARNGYKQGMKERKFREAEEMEKLEQMRSRSQSHSLNYLHRTALELQQKLDDLQTAEQELDRSAPENRPLYNAPDNLAHLPLHPELRDRLQSLEEKETSIAEEVLRQKQRERIRDRLKDDLIVRKGKLERKRKELRNMERDYRFLMQTEQQSMIERKQTEEQLKEIRASTYAHASDMAHHMQVLRGDAYIRDLAQEYDEYRNVRVQEISHDVSKREIWKRFNTRTRTRETSSARVALQKEAKQLRDDYDRIARAVGDSDLGNMVTRIAETQYTNCKYRHKVQELRENEIRERKEEINELAMQVAELKTASRRASKRQQQIEQNECLTSSVPDGTHVSTRHQMENAVDRYEMQYKQYAERTAEIVESLRSLVASLGTFAQRLRNSLPELEAVDQVLRKRQRIHRGGLYNSFSVLEEECDDDEKDDQVYDPEESSSFANAPADDTSERADEESFLQQRAALELHAVESMIEKLVSLSNSSADPGNMKVPKRVRFQEHSVEAETAADSNAPETAHSGKELPYAINFTNAPYNMRATLGEEKTGGPDDLGTDTVNIDASERERMKQEHDKVVQRLSKRAADSSAEHQQHQQQQQRTEHSSPSHSSKRSLARNKYAEVFS